MKEVLKIVVELLNIFKQDRFLNILLLFFLFIITLVHYLMPLLEKTIDKKINTKRRNVIMIRHDYNVLKRNLGDLIDSTVKLQAIINDNSINKDRTPEIGAMIKHTGDLSVVSKSKVETYRMWNLANVPEFDYSQGYVYAPNVYTEFQGYLEAMFLETQQDVETMQLLNATTPIYKAHRLKIGNLVVKNLDGSLYATTTDDFDMVAVNTAFEDRRITKEEYIAENNVQLGAQILAKI